MRSEILRIQELNIGSERLDQLFLEVDKIASSRVDCLSCANCCKTISPIILPNEIQQIAVASQISATVLLEEYIEMDEDGDFVFRMQPCPMLDLDTNMCKIYEHRPEACREFPHTAHQQMYDHIDLLDKNYDLCPIVQQVVIEINQRESN